MTYKIANETHITEQEKNQAYELLENNGFVILGFDDDDLDYFETLNAQVLKHETDFERIHNAA